MTGRSTTILDSGWKFYFAGNESLLSFRVEGPGSIVGVGNGDPCDRGIEKVPLRRAFSGLCQALLKTQGSAGTIDLSATSPGLMPGKLIVEVR